MAQQNTGGFGIAHPVPYSPESQDQQSNDVGIEPTEEKEPQSLEEALVG